MKSVGVYSTHPAHGWKEGKEKKKRKKRKGKKRDQVSFQFGRKKRRITKKTNTQKTIANKKKGMILLDLREKKKGAGKRFEGNF